MTLELYGLVFDVLGVVFISIAALSVHHRFLNEHRVDEEVLRTMRMEQRIGFFGVGMVVIGFFLQIVDKLW
mgnify:CR=1 FL=1